MARPCRVDVRVPVVGGMMAGRAAAPVGSKAWKEWLRASAQIEVGNMGLRGSNDV